MKEAGQCMEYLSIYVRCLCIAREYVRTGSSVVATARQQTQDDGTSSLVSKNKQGALIPSGVETRPLDVCRHRHRGLRTVQSTLAHNIRRIDYRLILVNK